MFAGTWFMLVVAVFALVMAIIPGRITWRVLYAWQFQDPEANEPSTAAHTVRRLGFLFGAVLLGILWFQLQDGSADSRSTEEKLRDTVNTAVSDLGRQDYTRFKDGSDIVSQEDHISQVVRKAAAGSLSVDIDGTEDGRYTVTAEGTDDAYCLSIRENEPEPFTERFESLTFSVSVTDWAC